MSKVTAEVVIHWNEALQRAEAYLGGEWLDSDNHTPAITAALAECERRNRKLGENEFLDNGDLCALSRPTLTGYTVSWKSNGNGASNANSMSCMLPPNWDADEANEAVTKWHRLAYLGTPESPGPIKSDECYPPGELPRKMADDEVRMPDGSAGEMHLLRYLEGATVFVTRAPAVYYLDTADDSRGEGTPFRDESQAARAAEFLRAKEESDGRRGDIADSELPGVSAVQDDAGGDVVVRHDGANHRGSRGEEPAHPPVAPASNDPLTPAQSGMGRETFGPPVPTPDKFACLAKVPQAYLPHPLPEHMWLHVWWRTGPRCADCGELIAEEDHEECDGDASQFGPCWVDSEGTEVEDEHILQLAPLPSEPAPAPKDELPEDEFPIANTYLKTAEGARDEAEARVLELESKFKKAEDVVERARQLTAYSWEDRLEDCKVSDDAKHDSRELGIAIWLYDQKAETP